MKRPASPAGRRPARPAERPPAKDGPGAPRPASPAGRRPVKDGTPRRARSRALAAVLLGVLALAACGIQKTDVVEAGGAATIAVPPAPEFRMVLYFLGPDGRLVPVVREYGLPVPDVSFAWGGSETEADRKARGADSAESSREQGARPVTDKVLAALLAGPAGPDTEAGLTTDLPKGTRAPRTEQVTVAGTTPEGRRTVRIRTPFSVRDLSDAAVQQLVCTAAYAEDGGGMIEAILTGADGTLPATRCER
ncbi:hypothetical protein ACIPQJ_12110 [Streptomyces sp. NPDC090082]|uniref:hypothetical protein n=1 Tax=unclassified Streptomyces TaxID=2593676 RepID=UPI003819A142